MANKEVLKTVSVKAIKQSKDNPRIIDKSSGDFKTLLESIRENGIIVPLIVREKKKGEYELRAGARRFSCAQELKLTGVPVIVGDYDDKKAFDVTFFENYARRELTFIEQSRAVEILMHKYNDDVGVVASKMNWTPAQVHRRIRLQKLSPKWLKRLTGPSNTMSALPPSHVELVARLPLEIQDRLLDEDETILVDYDGVIKPLKELKEELKRFSNNLAIAKFEKDTKYAGKPPCKGCVKRTDSVEQTCLWEANEVGKKDTVCLDPVCYDAKVRGYVKVMKKKNVAFHPRLEYVAEHSYQLDNDERETYGNLHDMDSLVEVKESTKGATPVMVVDGFRAGEVVWTKAQKPPVASTGKKKEKTYEDCCHELRNKMWCWMLEEIIKKLVETKYENLDFPKAASSAKIVIVLASQYGTIHNQTFPDRNDVAITVKALCENIDKPLGRLWVMVRQTMVNRLTYEGPITQLPPKYVEEGAFVAKLIGMDLDDLNKQGVQMFPEPKSWAKRFDTDKKKKTAKTKGAKDGE